jgi:beta-lactamase regulating signal transducer with metallopeptidase domain
MMADLALVLLARMQLAAAAAILLVLALRPLARRLIGAELAYPLWALVPVAALTSLFPTLHDMVSPMFGNGPAPVAHSSLLLRLYLSGAVAVLTVFVVSEMRFRRLAAQGKVGPAVVGLSWPSLVVPADYAQRFDVEERRVIREHERVHMQRRHPRDNRLIALIQVAAWFNPLAHLAARCARLDQELACDAIVMERLPRSRRLYAHTLLKAQAGGPWSVFACSLIGGRHPLEVRVAALSRTRLTVRQYVIGGGLVGLAGVVMAIGVWALIPLSYVR